MEEMNAGFSNMSRGIKRRTDLVKEVCKKLDNEE
jgi:hypothetical protein